MAPDTQPTDAAMEAAWPLDQQMHRNHGHDHVYCQFRIAIARTLDAYAAEANKDTLVELAAMCARAEAAEGARLELNNRCLAAEERVRVLEVTITLWLQGLDMMRTLTAHDARQATVVEMLTKAESNARAALLAKAAADPSEGGKADG